ncbi:MULTISPECIES: hypothetical protein [Enterobacteriaceae]|uniref:hypothetical protein n=1 Tax=Enterobacteriaceae TaxID=543 RepID=UPI000799E05A|nr:hypothetical protein [Enterobacter hormaechei]CZU57140.1 Uncharacterised protein [Enterobacter hormaechei]CZW79593.1 Uncharacterised protein [Enterobacter hormaechei]
MTAENGISCAQYITWSITVVGWGITMFVAWVVLRKNARNTWAGDLKKALTELEDSALIFWMSANDDSELLELKKLRRKVKEITTLALEIKDYGGPNYPKHLFIQLRRSVTTEKYHQDNVDFLQRELPHSDNRITEIFNTCADLRTLYKRDKKILF